MSTVTTAFNGVSDGFCAIQVQSVINTLQSQALLGTPNGVLSALTSPLNRQGFKLALAPNKDRPSATSHRKVYTEDVIPVCNQDTTPAGACATPSFTPDDIASKYKYAEHRITLGIKRESTLDLEDFKSLCKSPQEHIANMLLAFREGVHQEVNAKLTDSIIAYAGNYADGSNSIGVSAKNVSFTNTGGFFDPRGYSIIKDEFAKLGHPYANPFIVGGSQIMNVNTVAGFSGGTAQNGVNKFNIPNSEVDYAVDVAFNDGDQHLLTWAPGSLQVATYNDVTTSMMNLSVPNFREKAIISDPFGLGLGNWDFYLDVNPTGCIYKMRYELWFDLIMPTPYDGTCGKKPVLHFTVDCGTNACLSSAVGG